MVGFRSSILLFIFHGLFCYFFPLSPLYLLSFGLIEYFSIFRISFLYLPFRHLFFFFFFTFLSNFFRNYSMHPKLFSQLRAHVIKLQVEYKEHATLQLHLPLHNSLCCSCHMCGIYMCCIPNNTVVVILSALNIVSVYAGCHNKILKT